MHAIAPYAKAIVGALVAGLGALGAALTDEVVTASEWVAVASATLLALGVVFAVPNQDPAGEHQAESVQPPDYRNQRGDIGVVEALVIVLLVVVILVVVGVIR